MVGAQQPVRLHAVGVRAVAGSLRVFAANDDVRRAQFFNLLLGFVADAFAHRDKPDDRRRPDKDPQRGERSSHLLQQQALQPELNRAEQRGNPGRRDVLRGGMEGAWGGIAG